MEQRNRGWSSEESADLGTWQGHGCSGPIEAGATKVVRTEGLSGEGGYESREGCVANGLRAPLVPARAFFT